MNPQTKPATGPSNPKAIHFTLGLVDNPGKIQVRKPHNLEVTVRAEGVLSFGLKEDTMLTTGTQDLGLQALDVSDQHCKVGSFVPFHCPASIIEVLTAKHVKDSIMCLISSRVPSSTLTVTT